MRLRWAADLPEHFANIGDQSYQCVCHRVSPEHIKHGTGSVRYTRCDRILREVISGEDEALFGYARAMQELQLTSGAFLDIGGASTAIVTFDEGIPVDFASFCVGSLSLYKCCVKKIMPGDGSLKRLRQGNRRDF